MSLVLWFVVLKRTIKMHRNLWAITLNSLQATCHKPQVTMDSLSGHLYLCVLLILELAGQGKGMRSKLRSKISV